MMFGPSEIELSRGPRLHFVRPSVDMLFVSAAAAFGKRVAGVLLTGGGSDGAHGLVTIKEQGGVSIVQRPSEAADPTMPLTGIREDTVDYVTSLNELPGLLLSLAEGTSVRQRKTRLDGSHRNGKGRTHGTRRRQEDRKISQSEQWQYLHEDGPLTSLEHQTIETTIMGLQTLLKSWTRKHHPEESSILSQVTARKAEGS